MKTLLMICLLVFCSFSYPQSWNKTYNGSADQEDKAAQVVTDNSGNVYVTGYAIEEEEGGVGRQYVTIKYNSSGVQQWIAYYTGYPGSEGNTNIATSLAVDGDGNVYVTGYSEKNDVDDSYDIATIKYNSSGTEVWVNRYEPEGLCCAAYSIAVDGDGNVYVTGGQGVGAGSFACGEDSVITIKYNSDGEEQWIDFYNFAAGAERGNQIAVGPEGTAYVVGESKKGSTLDYDYVILKYDSNTDGDPTWVTRYSPSPPPFSVIGSRNWLPSEDL